MDQFGENREKIRSTLPQAELRAEPHASLQVAVLVPCYNEEATVAKVVSDFRKALPSAKIYVYDNNSTDATLERAREAGAVLGRELNQGKGRVVRRMFADVEADLYLLVDGDATYDAASADAMMRRLLEDRLDMVVGVRTHDTETAYRAGHQLGNRLFTWFVAFVFGGQFTDMLSGYRVFSRRFVKSFPILSGGFEIETEFTVHALELGLPVGEVATPYFSRPEGSASKLNTWSDGFRILRTIAKLYRSERPLPFFSMIGAVLAFISIALSIPIIATFLEEGVVPRFPTAILATGMMLAALLCFASGLILDTVTRGRREMKRLAYLEQKALAVPGD